MSCGDLTTDLRVPGALPYRRVTSAAGGRPTARPPRAPERPAAWTAGRGRRRVFGCAAVVTAWRLARDNRNRLYCPRRRYVP